MDNPNLSNKITKTIIIITIIKTQKNRRDRRKLCTITISQALICERHLSSFLKYSEVEEVPMEQYLEKFPVTAPHSVIY